MWYYVAHYADTGSVLGEQANNLSLFSGDVRLVRTARDPAVYALVGNKKYPIRNEEVFASYGYAFSAVRVVSPDELNNRELVRLAKNHDNGRVYFLHWDRGLKKYHPTPQHFAAYPSNAWGDVVELSARDLAFWPDATLLKTPDSPDVYAVNGSNKALIPDENAFYNAGFSWNRLMVVNDADLNAYQTVDFTQEFVRQVRGDVDGGNGAVQVPDSGAPGQLIVTLANDSPDSQLYVYRTARNPVAKITLRANGGKSSITGLTVTKDGIVADDAIQRLELIDQNGMVLGVAHLRSPKTWRFDFSQNPVLVPRGGTRVVTVAATFGAGTQQNATVRFGVPENAAVAASGDVSGVFPLFGASHRLAAADDLIGAVALKEAIINTTEREVTIGASKEEFFRADIEETSGNEDVEITQVTFTNRGSAADEAFDFLTLYVDGRPRTTVRQMSGRTVTFHLDDPLGIRRLRSATIALKADIVQGEGQTAKFVIAEPHDIVIRGTQHELQIVPQAPRWPVGQGTGSTDNKVVFKREGIGLFGTKLKDSEKEVYRATDGVVLGEFELRGLSQSVYLQSARVQLERFNDAPALIGDVHIALAGSNDDITQVDASRLSADGFDVPLNNFEIGGSKVATIHIIGDVPESAISTNAYRFTLAQVDYKIGADNTTYTHDRPAIGQVMRVYAPQLAVSPGEVEDQSVPAGTDEVTLGAFELTAGADERLTMTSVTISLTPESDDVTFTNGFENVKLYLGRRRAEKIIERPNSRTYIFSGLRGTIGAGRTETLRLQADTEVIAKGTVALKLEGITAEGGHSKAPVIISGVGAISPPVTIVEQAAGADTDE